VGENNIVLKYLFAGDTFTIRRFKAQNGHLLYLRTGLAAIAAT
jgi:hypothetical protein